VSIGGQTRTVDLRIMRPQATKSEIRRKSNRRIDKAPGRTHRQTPIDPQVLRDIRQDDPELSALIAVWPKLPQAIRTGIMAMIGAASKD
jgi:hypothetical protein